MPLYTKKNWAKGKIANYLDEVETTLEMQAGHSLPKNGIFPIVIWNAAGFPDPGDDPGVEIVVATYISAGSNGNDFYHIDRGQDNTYASIHVPGAQVALNITAGVGYADLGVIGTKEVDETGIADMSALIYDIIANRLKYKPVIQGVFDNDLRMFLLLGADNLNINLVEYIAVVEDVTMNDIIIELWDAYDESYAWDFLVELSLDVLNVEFSEDITVTEDIQMLDFVVELEVAEDILIGEVLDSFSLDVLYIEASDDILTEEAYDFNGAEFSEGDDLSVAEDVVASLEELNTEVGSDTSISEDIVAELNELNLEVGDDASVSEDIVPDLEITFDAFESLTGEEALELDLTLTLDESDTVVVSEDYSYEVV